MEADNIKCPQCGTEIEVGEVLARQVATDVEARLRQEAEALITEPSADAPLVTCMFVQAEAVETAQAVIIARSMTPAGMTIAGVIAA